MIFPLDHTNYRVNNEGMHSIHLESFCGVGGLPFTLEPFSNWISIYLMGLNLPIILSSILEVQIIIIWNQRQTKKITKLFFCLNKN